MKEENRSWRIVLAISIPVCAVSGLIFAVTGFWWAEMRAWVGSALSAIAALGSVLAFFATLNAYRAIRADDARERKEMRQKREHTDQKHRVPRHRM